MESRDPPSQDDLARIDPSPHVAPLAHHLTTLVARRRFLQRAAAGTVITAIAGGLYALLDDALTKEARAASRADGRPRVPPGQRVIGKLKPMGGEEGAPSPSAFRLRVHGEVDEPYTLDFRELVALEQSTQKADVHCVTGWTVLDAEWTGVTVARLAARAKVRRTARHVVFEAAHGYTANVPLRDAMKPNVLVAHRLDGERLAATHGAPVRGVVPDLYFWKSAKWLTGIRFVAQDEPGFWEVRGYHNHGDPWTEERYG